MGAYHTLDIEVNTDFSLSKDVWDVFDLNRLEESADATLRVCCSLSFFLSFFPYILLYIYIHDIILLLFYLFLSYGFIVFL